MTKYMFIPLIIAVITIAGCASTELARDQQRHEQPQKVLGTIVIGIAPTDLASLPEPPIDMTLNIKQLSDERTLKHDIADGTAIWELAPTKNMNVGFNFQNFRLMLPPGDYFLEGLDIRAKSLSDKPFFLPLGGPIFTIPKENCVYIGRIGAFYSRLPPGSLAQAEKRAGEISARAGGKPLFMIYLTEGALVAMDRSIDQPAEDERTLAMEYSKQPVAEAHDKQCDFQLAR